jgi:hypothetical protein
MTRADLEPGFWCEYREPQSAIAKLVQQPAAKIDGTSLANAYMADYRASRRASAEKSE